MPRPGVLTPAAEDLADLLVRMCQQPWPATEADRLVYFDALGLRDGDILQDPQSDHQRGTQPRRFSTSLPGRVDGISSTLHGGELLGLTLFAYTDSDVDRGHARHGYDQLKQLLSDVFADPVEQWGPPSEPACLWRPGPLLLEMYCLATPTGVLMVGPAHEERSTANDVAAIGRQAGGP